MSKNIIKRLRDDPVYRQAVASLKDDAHRKLVIGYTETFVTELSEALENVAKQIREDASLPAKLNEALTEAFPLFSGSTDR